jgi:sugar (pentulose or hexulose) kinase
MDILKEENVKVDKMTGHGGYFKTPVAGQTIMAAALEAPITVMETAGEGGAWGIAVLALYALNNSVSLGDFLNNVIFKESAASTVAPDADDVKGFNDYIAKYKATLPVEKLATESLSL